MSYAVETKKRKWDRLLDSFNDRSSPSRPGTAPSAGHLPATISLLPTFEEELAKKRRLQASSNSQLAQKASNTSLANNYLPSNRLAFLERLETFRSVTKWHIPSTEPVNSAEWAKRGWTCVDVDTVACGVCRERILVNIDLANEVNKENKENEENEESEEHDEMHGEEDGSDNEYATAEQVYEGIIKRFMDMIVTAHEGSCPWKRRGCDSSIQRVEGLLNTTTAISSLRTRYDSLWANEVEFPDMEPLNNESIDREVELGRFMFDDLPKPDVNALQLAICGWQAKGDDVVECRHCFRSLGLWLYRGEHPAMERLDTVESHLEYCPWRSSTTQDSEISVSVVTDAGRETRSQKVAGWYLVCQAIATDNAKRTRIRSALSDEVRPTSAISEGASSTDTTSVGASSEDREKRMKALLRRINAVKKPFNVKGLIKRKKESKP